MRIPDLTLECWDQVLRRVADELSKRSWTSQPWHTRDEEDLWHELASCILGSVVSFEQATLSFQLLYSAGLLRVPRHAGDLELFETSIANALAGRVVASQLSTNRCFPFPFLRARQLRQTAEVVYFGCGGLRQLLPCDVDPYFARAELVRIGCGVGPKQASLFLRNVGFENLAVLDRHVLQFMTVRGLVAAQIPVRTLAQYERAEREFVRYAEGIGIPVAQLDLAVWVAVRTLKRGCVA